MRAWVRLSALAGITVLLSGVPGPDTTAQAGVASPTTQYDWAFRTAAKRYLPEPYRADWRLLKAQCIAESGLRPDAVSPAGAQGLCQIMATTAQDLERRLALRGRLRDIRYNTALAAAYMRRLLAFWSWDRSYPCRLMLAWASYNAGPGNIAEAQKLSGMKLCWDGIAPHLPKVTGQHATETRAYVTRVLTAYLELRWAP